MSSFIESEYYGIIAAILCFVYSTAVILTGFLARYLGKSVSGWVFGSLFGFLVPSVILLFKRKRTRPLPHEEYRAKVLLDENRSIENAILKIAKANNGNISVADTALEAGITLDEAQKALDDLTRRGFVQMEVKDSGMIVYVFYDFMKEEE